MNPTITCARCQKPKALGAYAIYHDNRLPREFRIVKRDDTCRQCRGAMYRVPDLIVRYREREAVLVRQLAALRLKIRTLIEAEALT